MRHLYKVYLIRTTFILWYDLQLWLFLENPARVNPITPVLIKQQHGLLSVISHDPSLDPVLWIASATVSWQQIFPPCAEPVDLGREHGRLSFLVQLLQYQMSVANCLLLHLILIVIYLSADWADDALTTFLGNVNQLGWELLIGLLIWGSSHAIFICLIVSESRKIRTKGI